LLILFLVVQGFKKVKSEKSPYHIKKKRNMSQYTREQFIERIKAGGSFEGANLSPIDLSGIDYFRTKEHGSPCKKPANACKCNLTGANLNSTNLMEAKVRRAQMGKVISSVFTIVSPVDFCTKNLKNSLAYSSLSQKRRRE